MENINYSLTKCYKSREINTNEKPLFKLNAFCINLERREKNMEFINKEWKDYCNIKRFNALNNATASHIALLKYIYSNKQKLQFPIIIMEDDVYRKNNFTKYWNKLLDLKQCDYVSFDCFFLNFNNKIKSEDPSFVSLREHRAMGFNVYYKRFFDRFKTIKELDSILNKGVIDMNFTHNPNFINYTPKEQVCRQIVTKYSTTAKINTSHYISYYEKGEDMLKFYNS